ERPDRLYPYSTPVTRTRIWTMAELSPEAQECVRATLDRNPVATTQELQEAAQAVEPSIAELRRRQFNAGYVLPLKRAASAGKTKKARGGQKKTAGRRRQAACEAAQAAVATAEPARQRRANASSETERNQVRATLLQFARVFSAAE